MRQYRRHLFEALISAQQSSILRRDLTPVAWASVNQHFRMEQELTDPHAAGVIVVAKHPLRDSLMVLIGQETIFSQMYSQRGLFCSFGGRIHAGEAPQETAVREFLEETIESGSPALNARVKQLCSMCLPVSEATSDGDGVSESLPIQLTKTDKNCPCQDVCYRFRLTSTSVKYKEALGDRDVPSDQSCPDMFVVTRKRRSLFFVPTEFDGKLPNRFTVRRKKLMKCSRTGLCSAHDLTSLPGIVKKGSRHVIKREYIEKKHIRWVELSRLLTWARASMQSHRARQNGWWQPPTYSNHKFEPADAVQSNHDDAQLQGKWRHLPMLRKSFAACILYAQEARIWQHYVHSL